MKFSKQDIFRVIEPQFDVTTSVWCRLPSVCASINKVESTIYAVPPVPKVSSASTTARPNIARYDDSSIVTPRSTTAVSAERCHRVLPRTELLVSRMMLCKGQGRRRTDSHDGASLSVPWFAASEAKCFHEISVHHYDFAKPAEISRNEAYVMREYSNLHPQARLRGTPTSRDNIFQVAVLGEHALAHPFDDQLRYENSHDGDKAVTERRAWHHRQSFEQTTPNGMLQFIPPYQAPILTESSVNVPAARRCISLSVLTAEKKVACIKKPKHVFASETSNVTTHWHRCEHRANNNLLVCPQT